MRPRTWSLLISAALGLGCAEVVHVRVAQSPQAEFASQRTFRFLPVSTGVDTSATTRVPDDPMFESSITGAEVRHDIAQALEARGNRREQYVSDLAVAYYIASHTRLDVNRYEYGYPYWGWTEPWGPGWQDWGGKQIVQYERGTVIIDILDGASTQLLWRGIGVANVPDDPKDFAAALGKTVGAIMQRFPGKVNGPAWTPPVAAAESHQ